MTLADMLATDRDALMCDLWETYQVTDFEALPVKTLAALSFGLRDDSRIKRAMTGQPVEMTQLLLAGIFDCLAGIRWMLAGNPDNAPRSMTGALLGIDDESNSDVVSFATSEEWEAERRRILGEG